MNKKEITFERDGKPCSLLVADDNAALWNQKLVPDDATAADFIAVLQQNTDLKAQVLKALLPSEEEMAKALFMCAAHAQFEAVEGIEAVIFRPRRGKVTWEAQGEFQRKMWRHDVRTFRKAIRMAK